MVGSFDKVHQHYDNFMKFWGLYREEEILDLLNLRGDEIIVDLGGGTGHLASYLADHCKQIYILDQSAKMLSHVPVKPNLKTVLGNVLHTCFADQTADIVVLSDVFHHIKEQEQLIDEVKRILNQNGKLLIHDFNIESLRTKVLNLFEYVMFGKLYFRNLRYVEELFRSKGLIIDQKIDKGFYYFLVSSKVKKDNSGL